MKKRWKCCIQDFMHLNISCSRISCRFTDWRHDRSMLVGLIILSCFLTAHILNLQDVYFRLFLFINLKSLLNLQSGSGFEVFGVHAVNFLGNYPYSVEYSKKKIEIWNLEIHAWGCLFPQKRNGLRTKFERLKVILSWRTETSSSFGSLVEFMPFIKKLA